MYPSIHISACNRAYPSFLPTYLDHGSEMCTHLLGVATLAVTAANSQTSLPLLTMQLDKTLSFEEFAESELSVDWKAKATKDLKGIPLDDLAYTTSDGITLEPYFTEENSTSISQIGKTDWKITLLSSEKLEGVDKTIIELNELGEDCGKLSLENLTKAEGTSHRQYTLNLGTRFYENIAKLRASKNCKSKHRNQC